MVPTDPLNVRSYRLSQSLNPSSAISTAPPEGFTVRLSISSQAES